MGNAQREHKSAKSREWYNKNTTKIVKYDIHMFLYKHWIGSTMKRLEMKIEKLYYMTGTSKSYKILMPRENVGNARTLTLSITFHQVHWPILLAKSFPNKWKTTVLDGN